MRFTHGLNIHHNWKVCNQIHRLCQLHKPITLCTYIQPSTPALSMEITWIHILTPQPQTHTHTCVRARTHARTHTHSVISHIPSTEIGMNVYPHTKPLHHSAPRTCSYIQSVLTQPSVCTACTYVLYHRQHMRTMYYCTSMRTTYVLHIAYLGRLLSRSAVEPWSVSTLVTRVRGVSVSRLVTRVRGVSVTSDESVRCVCVYTSDESVRCVCV